MELNLEVVLSSSIKRKKPWPRFCWLGQEKESVFLLDDKRISEINMVSGRTKKKTPRLHHLLKSVVTMNSSHNGVWLCGLLNSGELFLWNRDRDLLKTAAAAPEIIQTIPAAEGNATGLSLQVSGDGMRVLMVVRPGQVFLWECLDVRYLTAVRDGMVKGQWAQIQPLGDTLLPSSQDKEASHHTLFIKTEVLGDACLSAFVFTSGKKLIITFLKIQWEEVQFQVNSVGYSIEWATKTYPLSRLTLPCQSVKSRGSLVPAFSPDGQLLAIVLNQRKPKATQVLFVSTKNFVSISRSLGGCGSKKMEIPTKYTRSYWVGSVSWSPDSLFLACVLKRGSLLMLVRLGELLTLSSTGCNIDFGPAQFLPLHPLVTYRPTISAGKGEASLSSSSLSVRDVLRQRYSVTWHPRLLYFIVSDGYMATVMRVLDRPSPAIMLKTLLKNASKDLEEASHILDSSQTHMKAWLESVSGLNLDSSLEMFSPTRRPKSTDTVISGVMDGSSLPLFLQDQSTLAGTKELLEKVQNFFEDDSDFDGPPVCSYVEDSGRLEFASMFDTLHALDTNTDTGLLTGLEDETDLIGSENKTYLLHHEMGKIRSKLLTAWAFGLSLGNTLEHRTHLLKQTLYFVLRFAAFLYLIPAAVTDSGNKSASLSTCILHLLKDLLTFLPWDSSPSDGPCCIGLVVDLCKRLVHLVLSPRPESSQNDHCQLSSEMLSTTLLILQQVSDSLDSTYSLQPRTFSSFIEKGVHSQLSHAWPSDVHCVPILQTEKKHNASILHQTQPSPQRPSTRLVGVWRWVYKITQQYMEELKKIKGCDGWEEEQEQVFVIMFQIQTSLQATGEKLEEGPKLLNYEGEHHYLCGLYPKSAEEWQSQICDESNKHCNRSVFQETRHCLALLYSLLSQYRLREAQELGDHMACLILHRAGHQMENKIRKTADSFPCPWLPSDLHIDAAFAVVQTLGRFMALYFTNQPLCILPVHNVAVLPPLHLPRASSVGRLVPLCQEAVSKAVRQQHLSEVWTVEYALDLLLLGGLLPECVWLAFHLRDWKTAVSLSLAYTSYCINYVDFTQLKRKELHLPTYLEPENIFRAKLECHLGQMSGSKENIDKDDDRSATDPLEAEDWELLQLSIQDILKACVMARVNILSSPLSSLVDIAKDFSSTFILLVPGGVYLPSPPLYCPQPSPNTQDQIGTQGQFAEVVLRHKVSAVLQRSLLLLRSARCCHPAAQWYISHLRRARHILHKIKKKYSYPSATAEEKVLPEGLMKFVTRSGFFSRGPNKDGQLDPESIQTIICFRELCGLCWMLHVRDQLSLSCRKYQAARQHGRGGQTPSDSGVTSACIDALHWACRFLPFCRFLNAEEILQDILLSLVSELPTVPLVADILVQAFPQEEESVRVPLREKYNSLLQRLRERNVLEDKKNETDELMVVLMQDKQRQRRKHLGRLQRHLAPTELHLWEKEEEEEDRGAKNGTATLTQLSLGTSLSTSTLADCGFPSLGSDGDNEAIPPEQSCRPMNSKKNKKINNRKHKSKTEIDMEEEDQPCATKGNEQPSLPVVGTWEFELEDEEYLNFLDLFLSYVLEKDNAEEGDSRNELPLLKGYSTQLRERELHSLTFDVLTTVHRRQRDGHHPGRKRCSFDLPVFRAGCCYKPVKQGTTPEPQTCPVWRDTPISRTSLSASSPPGLRTGKHQGLFSLTKQNSASLAQKINSCQLESGSSPNLGAFVMGESSENRMLVSSTSVEAVLEVQQGLDPKLESQFPELGRLLEWMLRWSERKVLLGHHGKRKKEKGGDVRGTVDERVVIRVKASAPAVLTSLSLLEFRYNTLLRADHGGAPIQDPETQSTFLPVLQPVGDSKLERQSSVDTGYPGSANTRITGLEHHLDQAELSVSGFNTGEPEEPTFPTTPPLSKHGQLAFDAQMGQSGLQQPSLDDLDVTPEKEGRSSNSEGLEAVSPVSNANICSPETSLKLADLDFSENADDISSSISLHSYPGRLQAPPHSKPQAPSFVQPEVLVHSDLSRSSEVLLANTAADSSNVFPQSSIAGAAPAVSTAPSQPLLTETPLLRQRVGEDLLRLVQHINYMSLMEVLGSSFSNLQLAQRSSSMAQSNVNSSNPNVPSSCAASFIPQPTTLPVHTPLSINPQTQAFAPNTGSKNLNSSIQHGFVFPDQPAVQSPVKTSQTAEQHHNTRKQLPTANDERVDHQDMPSLSVQAESPNNDLRESRKMIPPSQGLLKTSDIRPVIPTAPRAVPMNNDVQSNPAPQLLGPKLLHYNCPPLPLESAAECSPDQGPQILQTASSAILESHQQRVKQNNQAASMKADEERTSCHTVPRRQFTNNYPHDLTFRNCQPLIQLSEGSRVQKVNIFPPVLPTHAFTQNPHLLHFKPVPQSQIIFPRVPMQSSSHHTTLIPAPMVEMPMIKLLHIDSDPKRMLPLASPWSRIAFHSSTEQLTSSVNGRHKSIDAHPELLCVDPPIKSIGTASTPGSSSSKRQKRRDGARKAEVTFRPNDSIIPAQEPTEVPGNKEPPSADKVTLGQEITFQRDPLLTGQRLLDKAFSTSTELHAFASTCKRPPLCHDAATNTERASPPKLVDKAVSVSATASGSTSPSPWSAQVFNEHPVQDTEEMSKEKLNILDLSGRQFISVLDLEDEASNQESIPSVFPGVVDSFVPTSAQLHLLAASVTRRPDAPDAEPQPSDMITHQPTTDPEIPVESPSFSQAESNKDSGRVIPQEIPDAFDSEICQAIRSPSVAPHTAASTNPTAWFSSHLSEMDAQLAALQKIADCLEMDFTHSKKSVKSIDKPTQDLTSDVKSPTAFKKTVRLFVPQEAWASQPGVLNHPIISEYEDENLEKADTVPKIKSSIHYSTHDCSSQRDASFYADTGSKHRLIGASDISEVCAEENLGQSELSDTAEILDELIKEGYLSSTDVDVSILEAAHRSSMLRHRQHNSRMSQTSVLPEEERRELRIWMRRKQRERLAVYQKHREGLRERERKPFTSPKTAKPAKKNQETIWRTKEEKDKFKLLEQYHQRTSEAFSLVSDFQTRPHFQSPSAPEPAATRSTSVPPLGSTYRAPVVSTNDKRSLKVQAGQTQSHRPWTADVPRWLSEDYRRRLGLHRPVTSLPRDRLSQVTRRGMLTDTKSRKKATPIEERPPGHQIKSGFNRGSSEVSAVGRGMQRNESHVEGTEEDNLWETTSEINRQLDLEDAESNIVSPGVTDKQNDAEVSGMDWLDNLSEHSSSTLSKIDWAAIESMVAADED